MEFRVKICSIIFIANNTALPVSFCIQSNAFVILADTLGYCGSAQAAPHEAIPTSTAIRSGFWLRSGLMYTIGPLITINVH